MGQLGQGPDELGDIQRPKIHSWYAFSFPQISYMLIYRFEEQIEDGKLSRDGEEGSGGLEAIAAGGMHTLTIDEGGRVSSNQNIRYRANVADPNLGHQ